MTYLEFKPQWPLSEFVQLIWVWEDATNVHHLPRERIVPDGIVELVLHFGDPLVTYFPDKMGLVVIAHVIGKIRKARIIRSLQSTTST